MSSHSYLDEVRVAVIDGPDGEADVHLYWEIDGEMGDEIPWPCDWPEYVSTKFMEAEGYMVIVA